MISPSCTTWKDTRLTSIASKWMNTYIRLSFLSVLAGSLDWAHRLATFTEIVEVLVRDYFSFDKSPLKITMDCSSSLWCQASSRDRPASNLLLTSYAHSQRTIHLGMVEWAHR